MKHPHAELMHSLADNCQQWWRVSFHDAHMSDWFDAEINPPSFCRDFHYELKPKRKMLTRTVGPYPAPETVTPGIGTQYWVAKDAPNGAYVDSDHWGNASVDCAYLQTARIYLNRADAEARCKAENEAVVTECQP